MSLTDHQPERAAHQDLSDRSLLRRLRSGSEDAATQLYLRYAHRLRGLVRAQSSPDLARRVEAEEIVQSIFGSFFRGAGNGYYDVPGGEDLWKLFLVIALNKIRAKGAFHRAAKRDLRRTTELDERPEFQELADDQDTAALTFLRLAVQEAMDRLLPHHRQVVTLCIEGHDVADVARQMGRSKRTVERLLQEARKHLAHLLQEV
jgi:RNA polymerase sigma-70 factor (ECF subfamily)